MIDAFYCICNTYAFVFREPCSKPSNFKRQQQIKVLLCYLCTHSFISFDAANRSSTIRQTSAYR